MKDKRIIEINSGEVFDSINDAANKLMIDPTTIRYNLRGETELSFKQYAFINYVDFIQGKTRREIVNKFRQSEQYQKKKERNLYYTRKRREERHKESLKGNKEPRESNREYHKRYVKAIKEKAKANILEKRKQL